MDRRKLIGAILGVIAFVALIAGATFAWLTGSFTASTGNYNTKTKNFVITYAGSADIGNPVMLSYSNSLISKMTSATSAATSGDAWAAVTASKTANDAPASSFKLTLNVSGNTLTTNSIVWAVCKGDCQTTALISAINTSTPSATCASGSGNKVVACGVIPSTKKSGTVQLYNDTSTFNVAGDANQTYNVYFWLDGPTIADGDAGKTFSGYISASATQ